jgi:hypothetical protein
MSLGYINISFQKIAFFHNQMDSWEPGVDWTARVASVHTDSSHMTLHDAQVVSSINQSQ